MTVLDWFIRGATVGLCLMLATRLLFFDRQSTARLAALFIAGVACYTLVSAPGVGLLPKTLVAVMHAVAIFNIVFFWWFAVSLFEEKLRWPFHALLPCLVLLITLPFRAWGPSFEEAQWVAPVHQIVVLTLLMHVAYLVIRDFKSDLVETRRYFRWMVATLIPVMALAIVVVEIGLFGITIDNELLLLQAIALFLLVGGFALCMLQPRRELFAGPSTLQKSTLPMPGMSERCHDSAVVPTRNDAVGEHQEIRSGSSSINQLEIERLRNLMATGAYRKPGLTVGKLAEELSMPERRVRELINKQLGYRNFTAYLNDYRIGEATSRLADPHNARVQIAQIAYEVGFNSIGPFNRAFRQVTQQTPSEYRRQALADFAKS